MPAYYPKTCDVNSGCLFDAWRHSGVEGRQPDMFVEGGATDLGLGALRIQDDGAIEQVYPVATGLNTFANNQTNWSQTIQNVANNGEAAEMPSAYVNATFGTYKRSAAEHYKSVYETEDRLCAMGIKSIASAVLSCMGLFHVTQQPVNMGVMYTTRSILGGGASRGGGLILHSDYGTLGSTEVPTIADGAFDSYYYVLRLAEFYKILFADPNSHSTTKTQDCRIRYPLDLKGDFGKLIYVVFSATGSYTENDLKTTISEINKLYYKYKSTENVLAAMVREVNSRYSCLVDKEAQKSLDIIDDRMQTGYDTSDASLMMERLNEVTGSLDFEDEAYVDRDVSSLDTIPTPSDALSKTLNRYAGCAEDSSWYRGDDRFGGNKTRAEVKYGLNHELKLYMKLKGLRSRLDTMYDNYLRSIGGETTFSRYPMSYDVYKQGNVGRYLESKKDVFDKTMRSNHEKFKFVCELMNNLRDGTQMTDTNVDTLLLFIETSGAMLDGIIRTRTLLDGVLSDMAIWSGQLFYEFNKNIEIKSLTVTGDQFADLTALPAQMFFAAAGKWTTESITAACGNDNTKWVPQLVESVQNGLGDLGIWEFENTGKDTPTVLNGIVTAAYDVKGMKLIDIFKGTGNWDPSELKKFNNVIKLYYAILCILFNNMGATRLMGLGLDYRQDEHYQTGTSVIKDTIFSIFECKTDQIPHVKAWSKLGRKFNVHEVGGVLTATNVSLTDEIISGKDRAVHFIMYVYDELIKRFELSPVFSTMIGSVSRLSSSMGNLVNTTLSNSGIHVDISPLQGLLVDSLSYCKQFFEQFYEYLPESKRRSLINREDHASIAYNEYELAKIYQAHASEGVRYNPLIEGVNIAINNVQEAMINSDKVIYKSGADIALLEPKSHALVNQLDLHLSVNGKDPIDTAFHIPFVASVTNKYYGGNSILSAIVPSHYAPSNINGALHIRKVMDVPLMRLVLTGARFDQKGNLAEIFEGKENTFMIEDFSNCTHITSLIPALNYGIKQMLRSFFDYGTNKIYQGFIQKILNTKLAYNVEEIETSYPDIFSMPDLENQGSFITDARYVNYATPSKDALLTTSNALLIKELFSTIHERSQTPLFLLASLSDIRNQSLIDVFRLKLPMFREYFLKLITKCKMLRGFMTKGCGSRENKRHLVRVLCPWARVIGGSVTATSLIDLKALHLDDMHSSLVDEEGFTIGEKISLYGAEAAASGVLTNHPFDTQKLKMTLIPVKGSRGVISDVEFYRYNEEQLYAYFMDIITNVEDICFELATMCDNIHREYNVDSKYMELEADFATKRKRYGNVLYTPLSLLSAYIAPNPLFNELHSLETFRGTLPFKLQYGAREVLFSDSTRALTERYLDTAIKVITDANMTSRSRVDVARYLNFAKKYIDLIRFNFSVIDYSEITAVPDGDYKTLGFRGGRG